MEQYISIGDDDVLVFFCKSENYIGASEILFTKIDDDQYQVVYNLDIPNGDKTLEIKLISSELFEHLSEKYGIYKYESKESFVEGEDYDPLCKECTSFKGETFPCDGCDKFYHKECLWSVDYCNTCYQKLL